MRDFVSSLYSTARLHMCKVLCDLPQSTAKPYSIGY